MSPVMYYALNSVESVTDQYYDFKRPFDYYLLGACTYYGLNHLAGFGTSLNRNVMHVSKLVVISNWSADVAVIPNSTQFTP
eukprot:723078-Pleurochrysis_carterae.AAC.1